MSYKYKKGGLVASGFFRQSLQKADATKRGEGKHAELFRSEVYWKSGSHRLQPPCTLLCPWGASRKERSGTVRFDGELCLSGAMCRDVCPWHIPQRQFGVGLYLDLAPRLAGNGVMYKCDRCDDIVAKGGLPACIEICPEYVQSIGSLLEITECARRMVGGAGRLSVRVGRKWRLHHLLFSGTLWSPQCRLARGTG